MIFSLDIVIPCPISQFPHDHPNNPDNLIQTSRLIMPTRSAAYKEREARNNINGVSDETETILLQFLNSPYVPFGLAHYKKEKKIEFDDDVTLCIVPCRMSLLMTVFSSTVMYFYHDSRP